MKKERRKEENEKTEKKEEKKSMNASAARRRNLPSFPPARPSDHPPPPSLVGHLFNSASTLSVHTGLTIQLRPFFLGKKCKQRSQTAITSSHGLITEKNLRGRPCNKLPSFFLLSFFQATDPSSHHDYWHRYGTTKTTDRGEGGTERRGEGRGQSGGDLCQDSPRCSCWFLWHMRWHGRGRAWHAAQRNDHFSSLLSLFLLSFL